MIRKLALALALVIALCAPALATVGPLQTNIWTNQCRVTSGNWTCTVTTTGQASGNLLVVVVGLVDNTAANAVTITTPSGFTSIDSASLTCPAAHTTALAVYYQATTSAVTSVVVSATNTSSDIMDGSIFVQEFANYAASPVDQHAITTCLASSATQTGTAKTPSQTNDTVLAYLAAPVVSQIYANPPFGLGTIGSNVGFINPNGVGNIWLQGTMASNYSGSSAQTPAFTSSAAIQSIVETLLLSPGAKGALAGSGSAATFPAGGMVGYSGDPIFERVLATL